ATGRGPVAFLNPGLFTIPFACAAAFNLVPSDTSTPGALLWPAWILTTGLLAAIALDILGRGFDRVFRAEHILLVALMVVVYPEPLQTSYSTNVGVESASKAFLAVGIFATMAALGSSIRTPKLPAAIMEVARRQYSWTVIFRIMLICWGLAMLNYAWAADFSASSMTDGLLGGRWSAPWGRGQLGGWDAFRDFLSNFGFVV